MNGIGWAVSQLTTGKRVCRRGWNASLYAGGLQVQPTPVWIALQRPEVDSKMSLPYVYLKMVDNHLVPWLCSQTDLLAEDWEISEL